MKKVIAVILSLAAVLCLSSCSGGAPSGMTTASGDNDAFYLYVPSTWTVNTSGGTASAYIVTDFSNVSMTCMLPEDNISTVAEYVEYTRNALAAALKDYENENDGALTEMTLGGKDAVSFDYSAKMGTVVYKWRQIVTMKSDTFYILTYTSTAENFDSHLEELAQIVENVSFK